MVYGDKFELANVFSLPLSTTQETLFRLALVAVPLTLKDWLTTVADVVAAITGLVRSTRKANGVVVLVFVGVVVSVALMLIRYSPSLMLSPVVLKSRVQPYAVVFDVVPKLVHALLTVQVVPLSTEVSSW